ncbi:hypothetical protein [Chitinimonas sp.]|uniref:hypothetical protein n=1 Tax=Chitinimonas sp. TaxID=1934313 RepID=UPI0035AE7E4B
MPMIPGPLAATAYGAIKVAGYAYFARQFNQLTTRSISPIRFGLAKTAIGLFGGIALIAIFMSGAVSGDPSDAYLYLAALPVRLTAWSIALGLFYGFRDQPRRMFLAVLVGTAWSYCLDAIMWIVYRVIPGMAMPFC